MANAVRTIRLVVDAANPDREAVRKAAMAIRAGQLVAFPTETVYGLGADALNPDAVRAIFEAKGRPADNPLIVHIAGLEDLEGLTAETPALARALAARFWPGPLTLVLRKSGRVPSVTAGGLDTIAVRVPAHPVALALLREAQCPIAAPSANRSGRPSPTCAEHVIQDLAGRVNLVLDAGPCPIGVESTVLDITQSPPVLLRPGGVPREEIEAIVGKTLSLSQEPASASRSPGTRYRHYAPRAMVLLAAPGEVEAAARRALERGDKVGIMARSPVRLEHPNLRVFLVQGDLAAYARQVFAGLRQLDALGCEVIVAETVPEEGLGLAVMDRLRRAAAAASAPRASS